MKKRIAALSLAAVMTITALSGCGGSDKSGNKAKQTDTKEREYYIDVVLKTTSSEYWHYVMEGAKAYRDDHPNIKIEVKGATSETAYDEQRKIIERDISSEKFDAFAIAPLDADKTAELISGQKAPVIAFDTKLDAPEVISFVGTDNVAAAEAGGEKAAEAAKKAGWDNIKAVCISGVENDVTAAERLKGFGQGIEKAGGKLLTDETQYTDAVADKAVNSMEAIMQNHPEGVAIVCANNDDLAIAAARAARGNAAYENTIFIGFDATQTACEAILRGEETMSVAQQGYEMGYKAVKAAAEALEGKQPDAFIDSGTEVITKENAQKRLNKLKSYIKQR